MGAFGQSKSIGDPMGTVNVTTVAEYRRVINFAKPDTMTALVSRATGTTHPPMVPGGPAADARNAQPDHHSRAGCRQLGAGAEHLDDPVGLPEGRGRQQRNGEAAGRPADRLVFSCRLHVAVRLELHGDGVHQQSESGHQGRDSRRSCGRRRPSRRVRIFGLPEHERRAGADSRRAAAGRPADIRGDHRVGHAEPADARRAARAAARRRRHPRPPLLSRHRLRRPSSASETGSSRSAGTTRRSPSTWAITCSSSKAGRAMRAGWR